MKFWGFFFLRISAIWTGCGPFNRMNYLKNYAPVCMRETSSEWFMCVDYAAIICSPDQSWAGHHIYCQIYYTSYYTTIQFHCFNTTCFNTTCFNTTAQHLCLKFMTTASAEFRSGQKESFWPKVGEFQSKHVENTTF